MKLSILFLVALAISCVSAQTFLFGQVADLSARSGSSCTDALFDIFGPGCDATGCRVPDHGVGITITTSNSRTKETTFLRGCLQIDTMGPTGLVLTNIASPGTWAVLSSEALSCCSGLGQPFDVAQSSFSINYIEIDQIGRVFVRSVEGLTANFTLSCPNCGTFPAVGFAGELTIVFQFSIFPGAACPDVPIALPCTGGDVCECPTTTGGDGGDGGATTGDDDGDDDGDDGIEVTTGDGDGSVVITGDGDSGIEVTTGDGDGSVVITGDGVVIDDDDKKGSDFEESAASSLRAFSFF